VIDGMDWIEAYLRDLRLRSASQLIISATGHEARTPRSVEAHGHEERDEDGHPVGTRVSVRFGTGLVGSTNASGMLYGSLPMTVFYTALPMTEAGLYVSDQIVDDVGFTAGLVQPWMPPTVRERRRR
jgi:hypothetical protein